MPISSYPPTAAVPYELSVASGSVPGTTAIFRSSYNNSVGTVEATLWPKNTAYSFPASATTMTLYSTSTADTTQLVLIEGLNSSHVAISEVLTLNGQTGRNTVNSYYRINGLTVLTDSPVGNISVGTGVATAGVPTNTYGYINAGDNISSSAIYTVPAGYTLYITSGSLSAGSSTGSQTLTAKFYSIVNGVRYLTSYIVVANNFQFFDYKIPLKVPEKTDIYNNCLSSSGTLSATATFNGYLVQN